MLFVTVHTVPPLPRSRLEVGGQGNQSSGAGPVAHTPLSLAPLARNTFPSRCLLPSEVGLQAPQRLSESGLQVGLLGGLLPFGGAGGASLRLVVSSVTCGRFRGSFTDAPLSPVESHLPEGLEASQDVFITPSPGAMPWLPCRNSIQATSDPFPTDLNHHLAVSTLLTGHQHRRVYRGHPPLATALESVTCLVLFSCCNKQAWNDRSTWGHWTAAPPVRRVLVGLVTCDSLS